MTYITILFISEKDDPEKFKQVLDALNYCVAHDRYKNFKYEVQKEGEGIHVFSPNYKQAKARGGYFLSKFEIHFQVIKKDEAE